MDLHLQGSTIRIHTWVEDAGNLGIHKDVLSMTMEELCKRGYKPCSGLHETQQRKPSMSCRISLSSEEGYSLMILEKK